MEEGKQLNVYYGGGGGEGGVLTGISLVDMKYN